MKKLFFKIAPKTYLYILAAAILIAVICVICISCFARKDQDHVTGSGLLLDTAYWKTDANGFRYYDKSGFASSTGIDVSEWVGDINFKQIKKAGIDFVILRVGYRGYDLGGLVADNNLQKYLKQASAAGLKVGAYFVSQAISKEEAIEEADYVMEQVKGYSMEMPLYIDLEAVPDVARTDELTVKERTEIADAFCRHVEENGYRGGVYANKTWFKNYLNFSKIRRYDIWLADYSDLPDNTIPFNIWQYTFEGSVPGAEQYVDMNVRVELDIPDTP